MKFESTNVAGAWEIKPTPHEDSRGRFLRAWCVQEFAERAISFAPVQANMGFSHTRGTIRGLHYQIAPALEAKLVRCTRGHVFDVVVDLRADSPTRLQWHGVELSADNANMLYVPEGCAHGFQALSDNSEIHYMASAFYAPLLSRGVRYDDPALRISWPMAVSLASEQDRNWPSLATRGPDFRSLT